MKIGSIGIDLNLPRFLIFALIIINLFLTSLPLTNTLGYEISVINGIFFFLSSGFITLRLCKRENHKKFIRMIYEKRRIFLSIITIPFFISLISSVVAAKCPLSDGIIFYITIAVPAAFFGSAAGFFSTAISKKYSFLLFLFLFFAILFLALIEFFRYPQIYFYNPIFGFYPGTIYDEDLSVNHILVAYRVFNLAFFIGVVAVSEHLFEKNNLTKIAANLFLIIVIVIFFYLKPTLQFSSDTNRLIKNLTKSVQTESFRIHFPASNSSEKPEYAALLHEYYLDQIKTYLKITSNERIDSYIFQNRDQKRILLGAGNADIAKPWLNQIYLNSTNYEETLKHELVHVIGGSFGSTPFKVANDFNPSLIEGLAMTVENNYDGYPVHYMAKLAELAGYKFPIEELFRGFAFFTKTSSISYIYSGSFLKYLADSYGVDKIKKLYGNSNFLKIFGKNLAALALEYDNFLKNYYIDFNRYKAQLYFGGTTIFKKFCPRVAAAEVKKGWELFNARQTSEALKLFQKVFLYSNSYQSLSGIIASYSKEKKYSEAEKFLNRHLANFKKSLYYFYLELIHGDLLIKCDEESKAVSLYDSLLIQNPHIRYYNEVMIRKTILKEGIDSLKYYFEKNETLKYQTLLKMNEEELNYFTVPALFALGDKINVRLNEMVDALKGRIKVIDPISRYAALEISKLALKRSDYETAHFFALLTMNYRQDANLDHQYIENLRMINWFINNAEELKPTFIYKNEF